MKQITFYPYSIEILYAKAAVAHSVRRLLVGLEGPGSSPGLSPACELLSKIVL